MLYSSVAYLPTGEVGNLSALFMGGMPDDFPVVSGFHVYVNGKPRVWPGLEPIETDWGVYFKDAENYYFTGSDDIGILSADYGLFPLPLDTADPLEKFLLISLRKYGRSSPPDYEIHPRIIARTSFPVLQIGDWIVKTLSERKYVVMNRKLHCDEAFRASYSDIVRWLKTGKMPDFKRTTALWSPASAFLAEAFYPVGEFTEKPGGPAIYVFGESFAALKYRDLECTMDYTRLTVECNVGKKNVSAHSQLLTHADNGFSRTLFSTLSAAPYIRTGDDMAYGDVIGIGSTFVGEFLDESGKIQLRGYRIPLSSGVLRFPAIVDNKLVVAIDDRPIIGIGEVPREVYSIAFIPDHSPFACTVGEDPERIARYFFKGTLLIRGHSKKLITAFSLEKIDELMVKLVFY